MSEQRTILLVDDDADLVAGISARLRAAGYATVTAYNGTQGVAAAMDSLPDAILLDVRMPAMDGIEVASELKRRQETKDIPIVMLSACLSSQRASLEAGARFFLTKPYDGKILLKTLDTVVHVTNSPVEQFA